MDASGDLVPGGFDAECAQAVAHLDAALASVGASERLKIVLEPSGAGGLAALVAGRIDRLPSRVGVVLSGGNVDAR